MTNQSSCCPSMQQTFFGTLKVIDNIMTVFLTDFIDNDFAMKSQDHRVAVAGFVDHDIPQRLASAESFLSGADAFLNRFSLSPPDERKEKMKQEFGNDLANFLFISSVLNYGNIGTSETLFLNLMDLYRRYRFLFRPNDQFWVKLRQMNAEQSKRVMESLLVPLSGLFRTDFRKVIVPSWTASINFIRNACEGDSGNLFHHIARSLMINEDNPSALAIIQGLLSGKGRNRVKKQLGMNFALGPKTVLLLLSVMTENRRGFGVLRGVTREQIKELKAPVDSAVVRVMLNTGLVKITFVNPTLAQGKLARTDLTDVCQRGMDLLAERLGILPIELDEYVWAIGTIPCKHRGAFCFICPLTEICDSWRQGYVRESSGAEYLNRCFSFARPQTEKNALYLRGCQTCPQQSSCILIDAERGIRHPRYGPEYLSRRFSSLAEKLLPEELERIVTS